MKIIMQSGILAAGNEAAAQCCQVKRMLFARMFVIDSLTPLTPAVPNCCCSTGSAPYWANPSFLIFDIRALWRPGLSARVPECQKTVCQISMAKFKAITRSALKGLSLYRATLLNWTSSGVGFSCVIAPYSDLERMSSVGPGSRRMNRPYPFLG